MSQLRVVRHTLFPIKIPERTKVDTLTIHVIGTVDLGRIVPLTGWPGSRSHDRKTGHGKGGTKPTRADSLERLRANPGLFGPGIETHKLVASRVCRSIELFV